MHPAALALTAFAASAVLVGCAGGGVPTVSTVTSPTGRVQIVLRWPERPATATRLVPFATNSVNVSFLATDGTTLRSQLLVRPTPAPLATGDPPPISSTATFTNLPQGLVNVRATAFPNPDGTGVAQATATVPTTIVAGQLTPVKLAMGSTISYVDILPHQIQLTGKPVLLNAVAYDAQNNVVLTDQWTWTNSDPTVITMKPSGALDYISAVGPGVTILTATETDSGKSFAKTINVAPLTN